MFFLEFSTSGEEQKKYFLFHFNAQLFAMLSKKMPAHISILKVELFTFGEVRKLIYNASNPLIRLEGTSWNKRF